MRSDRYFANCLSLRAFAEPGFGDLRVADRLGSKTSGDWIREVFRNAQKDRKDLESQAGAPYLLRFEA